MGQPLRPRERPGCGWSMGIRHPEVGAEMKVTWERGELQADRDLSCRDSRRQGIFTWLGWLYALRSYVPTAV